MNFLFTENNLLLLQVEQNPLLGFGAIAIAVLCSGFAGKS